MNNQEIEVKFYVTDLAGLRARLAESGASLVSPRVHEVNLRFDTPARELTEQHRVLRLRRDDRARLTYKGPAQSGQSVAVRQEIETEVQDFDRARALLEALGYTVSVMYEKYRTTYHLRDSEVVLDELPFGYFVEIEAPDAAAVQRTAMELGLDWDARITLSYLALFDRLKSQRGLPAQNLSFDELEGLTVSPGDLGVQPADRA